MFSKFGTKSRFRSREVQTAKLSITLSLFSPVRQSCRRTVRKSLLKAVN